ILIFFGQRPAFELLIGGLNPTFLRGTLESRAIPRVVGLVLLFSLALALSWRRAARAGRAWWSLRRLALTGVSALALLLLPVPVHRRGTARNPLISIVQLAVRRSRVGFSGPPAVPMPLLDPASVRELGPSRSPGAYFDERFPLAHLPEPPSALGASLPAGVRPNFVFLVLEGVRAEDVGAYGGAPDGLTPNIDRLARSGIVVEEAYSPGTSTPDAELALWYGVLPNPLFSLMTRSPSVPLSGLPEILRSAGWRSFLWIHNGDQTFFRRDRFYLPRRFQMVDGRDFPASDVRTSWGYSDRALARRAVKALDRAREPFAALVLTVSNHHPFRLPDDARSPFPDLSRPERGFLPFVGEGARLQTASMLRTVHYTDEAVGDFFRMGQTRPWFSRTVFIVLGDHGLSIAPYQRQVRTIAAVTDLRHRVPMIFFSPMLKPGRISGPASQADVPETLLSLARIPFVRSGVGRDLFDPGQLDADRRVVTWRSEGNLVTVRGARRTYQAVGRGVLSRVRPIRLEEETFFDPRADPQGERNLMDRESAEATAYRRLARVYLEVYPWVVVSGRSGVPEATAPAAAAGPGPPAAATPR
ncbi:MAG: LTA synthase family protein, partial [Acidobacteriota bacterium]